MAPARFSSGWARSSAQSFENSLEPADKDFTTRLFIAEKLALAWLYIFLKGHKHNSTLCHCLLRKLKITRIIINDTFSFSHNILLLCNIIIIMITMIIIDNYHLTIVVTLITWVVTVGTGGRELLPEQLSGPCTSPDHHNDNHWWPMIIAMIIITTLEWR